MWALKVCIKTTSGQRRGPGRTGTRSLPKPRVPREPGWYDTGLWRFLLLLSTHSAPSLLPLPPFLFSLLLKASRVWSGSEAWFVGNRMASGS